MKIHHRTIDAARRTSSTSTPLKMMTGTEDSVNEVYMERTIGLLGGIGLVLGSIIGVLRVSLLARHRDTIRFYFQNTNIQLYAGTNF